MLRVFNAEKVQLSVKFLVELCIGVEIDLCIVLRAKPDAGCGVCAPCVFRRKNIIPHKCVCKSTFSGFFKANNGNLKGIVF